MFTTTRHNISLQGCNLRRLDWRIEAKVIMLSEIQASSEVSWIPWFQLLDVQSDKPRRNVQKTPRQPPKLEPTEFCRATSEGVASSPLKKTLAPLVRRLAWPDGRCCRRLSEGAARHVASGSSTPGGCGSSTMPQSSTKSGS